MKIFADVETPPLPTLGERRSSTEAHLCVVTRYTVAYVTYGTGLRTPSMLDAMLLDLAFYV
jgi:hypothetical protein